MKTNSTAPKLEQKNELPVLTVVIPEKAEQKEQKTDETPEAPAEPAKVEEAKKQLTIEEIKRKNEILRRLVAKHEDISLKLWRIENFKISADRETATVQVTDASGEEFQSNSPKTIGKLIEFWTDEFKNALAEIEKEIRENA